MTRKGQAAEAKGYFFHVTHDKNSNKWHVKEVRDTEYETYNSKEEAIKHAEENAKNVEQGHVVIHREDGKFDTVENF